jgi:hypothetical protein
MIPAGFLSVIRAAASSSRKRAAGSADKVTFSAIPIRSWTERAVERAGASDDIIGLLRFGWAKECPGWLRQYDAESSPTWKCGTRLASTATAASICSAQSAPAPTNRSTALIAGGLINME